MKTKKKINLHSNKIHNTKRSRDSNFLTTFLDNYKLYFSDCAKFSKKSSNLNYFYSYYLDFYQKFKKVPVSCLSDNNLSKEFS